MTDFEREVTEKFQGLYNQICQFYKENGEVSVSLGSGATLNLMQMVAFLANKIDKLEKDLLLS